jgi:hypothetical protein
MATTASGREAAWRTSSRRRCTGGSLAELQVGRQLSQGKGFRSATGGRSARHSEPCAGEPQWRPCCRRFISSAAGWPPAAESTHWLCAWGLVGALAAGWALWRSSWMLTVWRTTREACSQVAAIRHRLCYWSPGCNDVFTGCSLVAARAQQRQAEGPAGGMLLIRCPKWLHLQAKTSGPLASTAPT